MKANKYLDQQSEVLAQRHQKRLQSMRETALQHQRQTAWWLSPFAMMLVPAATVALLVVSVWTPELLLNETMPEAEIAQVVNKVPANMPSNVPAWVADTQVPVAVLENIKFYEWLSHELNKKQS